MRSVGVTLVKLIATATSGLVSFTTNVIRPVKVTCEFSPVQEGTGDPSPDNMRPISGWTGCETKHTGKNLFDMALLEEGTISGPGADVPSTDAVRSKGFIPIKANVQYVLSCTGIKTSLVKFFGSDGVKISETGWKNTPHTFTCPDGTTSVRFIIIGHMDNVSNVQLELGSAATAYESYQGETIPISWQSEAGTIYGGTVTLNEDGSADIVANKAGKIYIGDASESWNKFGSGSASAFAMKHPLSNFINTNGAIIADYLVTIGKDASWGSYDNWVSWANPNVLVTGIKSITTVAAWKAYLAENPLTIVYNLRSPLSYHLDNVGQLQSFLGTNTIWHNMNGDITVEYWNKQ